MSSFLISVLALGCLVGCVVMVSDIKTVPEIIRWKGYICEEHFVTTEDGYILSLHRIPYGKNSLGKSRIRHPVMMQHGLFSSSATWTLNLTHKTPAFLMADAGYDVWLPNIRGNTYSKNHTHLAVKSKEFWQFSWDEMARYDIPAFIDYILEETKHKQLFYVGHSMGTTVFFAGLSMQPKYNSKIKAMFALAPVGTVSFIKTWFAYLSYVRTPIEFVLNELGDYEIAPANSLVAKLMRSYCKFAWITTCACENFLFLVVGFDKDEFDPKWMPAIMDELLAGTSLNTLMHYAQEYSEGRFQKYDFGHRENLRRYKQIEPPEYHVTHISTPVHLIWGMNDDLADDKDVQYLIKYLPNAKHSPVPYKKFNHLDFLWAKNAKELVYDPMLKAMSKY